MTPGHSCLQLANCHACPLREANAAAGQFRPVPAELNEGATVLLIDDSPGKQETMTGRAFTGPNAAFIQQVLQENKVERKQVSYTYAVACRYPNDRPEEFLGALQRRNRARARKGEEAIPTPAQCCAPRLEAEIKKHEQVIALGSSALHAVGVDPALGAHTPSLTSVRGFPTVTGGKRQLPMVATLNYAHRDIKWRPIVKSDIAKAFRYFRGEEKWEDPRLIIQPSVDVLRRFFERCKQEGKTVIFDVETAPYAYDYEGNPLFDGLKDELRMIGFGTEKVALVLMFKPVDGQMLKRKDGTQYANRYDREQARALLTAIREWLADADASKAGHNAGSYDAMVCLHYTGQMPKGLTDTILLHKLAFSEYRHNLGFIASLYTSVPPWKSETKASEASSDEELAVYNGRDLKVTALIHPVVRAAAAKAQQLHLYEKLALVQEAGVGMHRIGMYIDEEARREHDERLTAESDAEQKIILDIVDRRDFNPNSSDQLRALLFDHWELPIQGYTETGEPTTGDDALRALLTNPLVEAEQREFIRATRAYRAAQKNLGFVRRWVRGTKFVDQNGHIRPDYNAHGTVGWRYSSSNPNIQQIPKELRTCFVPPEGCLFVGADYEALELRMVTAVANIQLYLDVFERGDRDAHNASGENMLGPTAYYDCEGAPSNPKDKGTGKFYYRRNAIKTIVFSSLYGAGSDTVFERVNEMQISSGVPANQLLTRQQIRYLHRKLLDSIPELKVYWEAAVEQYRRQGYIDEPIWGMRRFFANGEEFNEIVNFPIQAGGGALVHDAMFSLIFGKDAPLPFDFDNGTGLCLQVHDALMFTVPEAKAKETEQILVEYMTKKYPHLPVTFTVDPGSGTNWKQV